MRLTFHLNNLYPMHQGLYRLIVMLGWAILLWNGYLVQGQCGWSGTLTQRLAGAGVATDH